MRGRKGKKKNSSNNNNTGITSQDPTAPPYSSTSNTVVQTSNPLLTQNQESLIAEWHNRFSKPPLLPNNIAPNYIDKTLAKHSRIAYDSKQCIATTLDEEGNILKQKQYKKTDPIDFIIADQSMPGALKPAAARKHRFEEENKNDDVLEDKNGNKYVICPAHGEVVKVESLQTDHVDSASAILQKQCTMVEELNNNNDLASIFIKRFGYEDLFVKVKDEYQGTLYFYEKYYNDIQNLWNICQVCNLHKNDEDPLEWFSNSNMFGEAFIDHLSKLEVDNEGFVKSAGGLGLAEIAISWYRDKYKDSIETTKTLYRNVIFNIQENLQKAAQSVTSGNDVVAAAYNAQAGLMTSLTTLVANTNFGVTAEGTMSVSSNNSQSTSDEDKELLEGKINTYKAFSNDLVDKNSKVNKTVRHVLKDEFRERVRQDNMLTNDGNNIFKPNDALHKHHLKRAEFYKSKFEYHKDLSEKYENNNQPVEIEKAQTADTKDTESNKRKLVLSTNIDSDKIKEPSNKSIKTERNIYGNQSSLLDLTRANTPLSQTIINTNLSSINSSSHFKVLSNKDNVQINTNNNSSMHDDTQMEANNNTISNNSPSPRKGR
jgi:hypothetical protein